MMIIKKHLKLSSMLLVFFCISFFTSDIQGQVTSTCKEYIYLNSGNFNPNTAKIHKFEVGSSGPFNEVMVGGNAWYPGTSTPDPTINYPHGLGTDRNGFLYIGTAAFSPNYIRRFDGAGNLKPTSEFVINNPGDLLTNVDSYNGFVYSNGGDNKIYKWNPCDGTAMGYVQLGDFSPDWGFSIDDNGKFYVTNPLGRIFVFTPTDADFTANTTYQPVIDLGANPTYGGLSPAYSGQGLQGITVDAAGNIYVVEGNRDASGTPSRLLKFSPTFTFLASSPIDSDGGNGAGWNQMTGVVYSSTTNKLYTSSLNPAEDCLYGFNTDLTPAGAVVGPDPSGLGGKGLNILKECCPTSGTIDKSVCGVTIGQRISLADLINTNGGVINDGQWAEVGTSTGLTFNDCDLTVTVTGNTACGSFTITNVNTPNKTCADYTITLNVSMLPSVTAQIIAGNQTLCPPDDPQAFTVTTAASTTPTGATIKYQWQSSTTSSTSGFSNILNATSATYDSGPVSQTTYFRVIASVEGCTNGMCSDTSNVATLTISNSCCTPPTAVTATSNSPVNEGSAINLSSSSTGGTSYSWSGPNSFTSTTQNPSIANATTSKAGTYTVTVLSSGTCTATATVAVVVTPTCTPPTAVTATSNSPVNEGSAINLSSSSTGGTSYSWSGPNSFTSTTQNPSITSATSAMAGTYTVTVLSSGTCTATATVAVVVTPTCTPPTAVTASSNSPVNEGSAINLSSSSTGGTSYSWSGPNSFVSTSQNPSIASATSLMSGTYTVTVLSSGTCTATATVALVVTPTIATCTPPTGVTASSNSPVNEGSAINLSSSSTGGTSYSWSGPNSFVSTSQNPTIASATSLMSGTYTVTVLSSGTCTATATVAVVVTPTCTPPTGVTATSNSPVNEGSAINLSSSSTGGTSYSWSGPNSFTSTTQNPSIASATTSKAGTYTVTVLSSGTCTATATVAVVVTPTCTPPTGVAASSNSPVNEGSAINLSSSSTGGTSYSWSGPNSFVSTSQNPTIASATSLMSGTYTVTVLSSGTCTATATVAVVVTPTVATCTPPTAVTATSNSPVNEGSAINLSSSSTGGTSYSWSGPNSFVSTSQNPSIASATTAMAGTYTVTVLSSGTCTATATVAVVVTPTTTPPVDLALSKTILGNSNCQRQLGDTVTFKIVVKRQDIQTVTVNNISVKDSVSAYLSFISATTSKGIYDNTTKLWTGINLSQGDSAVMQIKVKISNVTGNLGGLMCNSAWIMAMDGTDIDSQPGNMVEIEDDFARSCVSVPIKICTQKNEKVQLTAPAGYTSYQWYDSSGQPIAGATGQVYLASAAGSYTVRVDGNQCPNNSCCPIYIEEFCECTPTVCLPIKVTKRR